MDTARRSPHDGGRYSIRVAGRLDPRWSDRFDGMALAHDDDGTTVIEGTLPDQAALHGLLRTLRDLGLSLISLTHSDKHVPDSHTAQGE